MNKHLLLISNLFSTGPTYGGVCNDLAARLSSANWQIITTSSHNNRLLRPIDMLWTVWSKRQSYSLALIDVFSGRAFLWAETTACLLRSLEKSYVLILRGGNLPAFSTQHPKRVQSLLKSAVCVTTPSSYLIDHMSTFRKDLRLLPNPIDLTNCEFVPRHQLIPELVWLRAFHNIYNPGLAAQTIALLKGQYPNIRLTMVGPDKGDGSLADFQQLVESLHVKDDISVMGGVSKLDVPYWLNRGDIFINTTNHDNTPVSVIEAMACGLCVVSTDVGGIPYLLDHEHNALLVPPNDPHAMAAAVRRVLTEPDLAERLSRNARAKAEQYDWSVVLPQWEKLLETALDQQL
jgi:glycosyltransferase involved in cell wall biosynthesis